MYKAIQYNNRSEALSDLRKMIERNYGLKNQNDTSNKWQSTRNKQYANERAEHQQNILLRYKLKHYILLTKILKTVKTTKAIIKKTPIVTFDWEELSVEERKRRVRYRMQNLGKYKGTVVFNNPKLRGES